MPTRIQFRRGEPAVWASANTILADGEPGYEKTTGRLKVGDGVQTWADLPYIGLPATMLGAPGGIAKLGADGKLLADQVPLLIQTGEVLMTSATPAGVTQRVTFPTPYAQIPFVCTDVNSKAAVTTARFASASNVSTTGFDLFFARSTTVATSVDWVAIGEPGASIPPPPPPPPPVGTGTVRYVAPTAQGTGDGDSMADAAGGLAAIPGLIAAGATDVRLLTTLGNYPSAVVDLVKGGTSGNKVQIRGVAADGTTPAYAVIVGTRVTPYVQAGPYDSGSQVFRFSAGADHLHLSYLDIRHVEEAFTYRGPSDDTLIEFIKGTNVRRFQHNATATGQTVAVMTNAVFRDWVVNGVSKGAVRFAYTSNNCRVERVVVDAQRQDGDNFCQIFDCRDQTHDIAFFFCEGGNAIQTQINGVPVPETSYWNADAFVAEEGCYNVTWTDCKGFGCSDGGFDIKADVTKPSSGMVLTRCEAWNNKRNFRFHRVTDAVMNDCIGRDAVKEGGDGRPAHGIWLGDGVGVTANNCTFSDQKLEAPTDRIYEEPVFLMGGGSRLTLNGGKITTWPGGIVQASESTPNTYTVSGTTQLIEQDPRVAAASDVKWLMSGNTTKTTTTISVKTPGAQSVRVKLSTAANLGTSPRFSTAVSPGAYGESKHVFTGLTAGAVYYYNVETDGVMSTQNKNGRLRTALTSGTVTIATSSCAEDDSDEVLYATMAARNPDWFIHTGDMHYGNSTSTSQGTHALLFDKPLSLPNPKSLWSNTNLSYIWSDHDSGPNNHYLGATRGLPAAAAIYRRYFPHFPLPDSGNQAIYHTFNLTDRVRVLMCDTRTFRTVQTATDNASKTLLGAEQKQWVKDTITAAPAGTLFFFVCETHGWTKNVVAGADTWEGYSTERTELANFFKASGKKFFYLTGDAHYCAYDNGTNTPDGFPGAICSAIDKAGTSGAHPWSIDAVTGVAAGARSHNYGWIEVTDPGTGSITVKFTAHSRTATIIPTQTAVL